MAHRLSRVVLGLVAAGLVAAPVGALPYLGTLTLNFNDSIFVSVSGTGEGVSTPDRVALASGGVNGVGFSPITSVFPIVAFDMTGGIGTASFVRGARGPGQPARLGGTAPLTGQARAGLFGTPFAPFAFLTLPLSIAGNPGAMGIAEHPQLGVRVSAIGNGWTTGLAQVLSTGGLPLVSSMGFDARTADGVGTVSLVTPSLVHTNIAGFEEIGLSTRLTLEFGSDVPGSGMPSDPDPGSGPGGGSIGDTIGDLVGSVITGDGRGSNLEPSAAVPEPGALALFAVGGALIAGKRRRRP